MFLNQFKYNIFSQNGEDGIIKELLVRLNLDKKISDLWCVEFGAWDGIKVSNTFSLVKNGCHAVYIEGDEHRYKALLETVNNYPNIIPVNQYVGFLNNSENNLNHILNKTHNLPEDYDILSIDIDSFDLAVWESYTGRPKIVIIEINSSIRPGIRQFHDGQKFKGNSFSSTLDVAKNKEYTLVCHTGNLIFIRNDLIDKIKIPKVYTEYPELLFDTAWINDFSDRAFVLKFIIKMLIPSILMKFLRKLKR